MSNSTGRYQTIYGVVQQIPAGRVATYGQIAALAGFAGCARQVGYALSALPDGSSVPWHRVVNAQGCISPRSGDSSYDMFQRIKLEDEGVELDELGRIALKRFGWRPGESGRNQS